MINSCAATWNGATGFYYTELGLTWPPLDADPVDRLAYIDDDEIRARAAQRIVDEATTLARRARVVRDGVTERRGKARG